MDKVSMRGHIQSNLNMTEAVTPVWQIKEQCKEVSTRKICHSATTGESKIVALTLFRSGSEN